MSDRPGLLNRVRDERLRRGWSQDDLARRSGLSRAGVSAIETDRLVPSAMAALSLASAFDCRVEDLFALPQANTQGVAWAWPPARLPCRFWTADVGGRIWLYPVEASPMGVLPHDGVATDPSASSALSDRSALQRSRTLVMASCDPAVSLLAAELERSARIRLIALPRSSRAAMELLRDGLVHVAGVHLGRAGEPSGNDEVARSILGAGFTLIQAARWEEGLALASGSRVESVAQAVRGNLRWIGREPGSGARQCLDELLAGRRSPRRLARDHRGVAEAVRAGWADAGVCLRLAVEEAGLTFLPVQEESYDLCLPDTLRDDPRIASLLLVLRSTAYRRLLGELPGYDSRETGDARQV